MKRNGPSVLVVDDDPALLEALSGMLNLRMKDLCIETCDSALAALERVEQEDFDVVICDIKMPGMDGLALLEKIHALRPDTPVILITGHGEGELAIQAIRVGAYDFLQKPLDREYMEVALQRALALRQLRRRLQAHQQREHLAFQLGQERLFLLQLILDEMPISVCLVQGEEARLVLANRAAMTVWGSEWFIGQSMQEFLNANSITMLDQNGLTLSPTSLATLHTVQKRKTLRENLQIIRRKDGTILPTLVSTMVLTRQIFPLEQEIGEISENATLAQEPLALVVHQDVTEQVEMERRKDEFIAMASHELKTPLTSLKIYTQTLQQYTFKHQDEMSARVLTRMDVQLDTLTNLVNTLLDVTRMSSGRLPWEAEVFDLVPLVRGVVEDLRRFSPLHQISLQGATEPIQIEADRERIVQLLTNLLNNAIKYSPQRGEIVVKHEASGDSVTVSVQDSGLGIPIEAQAHIFERFYRVKGTIHETFPGLGLGLYLCAEIVRLQGGQIWVESTPGVGSTFFFTLVIRSPSKTIAQEIPT